MIYRTARRRNSTDPFFDKRKITKQFESTPRKGES